MICPPYGGIASGVQTPMAPWHSGGPLAAMSA
jgi:hypothetical protein